MKINSVFRKQYLSSMNKYSFKKKKKDQEEIFLLTMKEQQGSKLLPNHEQL